MSSFNALEHEKQLLASALGSTNVPEYIQRLDENQIAYIFQDIQTPTFLEACPGSGKTEVIAIKLAYELSKWKNKNSGIAVLSFTVSASNELEERIRKYSPQLTSTYPHFIGTFDSWLHNYLLHSHAWSSPLGSTERPDKKFIILSNDNSGINLHGFKYSLSTKAKREIPIAISQYNISDIDNGILKIGYAKIALSDSDKQALKERKLKAFKSGFVTYGDVGSLVLSLLTTNTQITRIFCKRFPMVLIDECQDLSPEQNEILNILIRSGCSIHYVGDLNQSIYEFRRVDPDITREFIRSNNLETLSLVSNFRSNQSIVDVCCSLQNITKEIVGLGNKIDHPCVLWEYTKDNLAKLPIEFEQYLEDTGIKLEDSEIVARGHSTLKILHSSNNKFRVPAVILATALFHWNSNPKSLDKINAALISLGWLLSESIHGKRGGKSEYYCPDARSKIEWRHFLSKFLVSATSSGLYSIFNGSDSLTWKDFAKRYRNFIEDTDLSAYMSEKEKTEFLQRIKAPKKQGDNKVAESFFSSSDTTISKKLAQTIHSVKGRTRDAILCVSSIDKKSEGGHVEHWLSNKPENDEARRFAYVAWSRPKHLLILAIPTNTSKEAKEKLQRMGFFQQEKNTQSNQLTLF